MRAFFIFISGKEHDDFWQENDPENYKCHQYGNEHCPRGNVFCITRKWMKIRAGKIHVHFDRRIERFGHEKNAKGENERKPLPFGD